MVAAVIPVRQNAPDEIIRQLCGPLVISSAVLILARKRRESKQTTYYIIG